MEILCVDDNSVGATGGTKSVIDSFSFTVDAINTAPYFKEKNMRYSEGAGGRNVGGLLS